MASTPFGEHLRRERELRGVSLDEVSAGTRIKTSFLEALENGRWEQLPGGAFNRGFIRATSRFLGLDEDGMVAEYALETGAVAQIKSAPEPSGAMPRDYRPAAIALCAFLVIVIIGAWFARHEYRVYKQKRAALAAQAATATPAATTDQLDAASADPPEPADPAPASARDSQLPASETTPSTVGGSVNPSVVPDILQLKVAATKRTDVKIVGDGKTLFKGRIRSDAPKTFEAHNTFEITASDAALVQLELNGRNIAFPVPTGHRAGSVSLDRKDFMPLDDAPRQR